VKIYLHSNKKDEQVLRIPTEPVDFSMFNKQEMRTLIASMRATMKRASGVGLSANQVGISKQFFVAQIENKFYAIFNPKLTKKTKLINLEEGCLSVPENYGIIERYERVTLQGYDMNGKKLKINAWGLLAQVFQHEIDHLYGKLFIDEAKKLYPVSSIES